MAIIIHGEGLFLDPVVLNDALNQPTHHYPIFKQNLEKPMNS